MGKSRGEVPPWSLIVSTVALKTKNYLYTAPINSRTAEELKFNLAIHQTLQKKTGWSLVIGFI